MATIGKNSSAYTTVSATPAGRKPRTPLIAGQEPQSLLRRLEQRLMYDAAAAPTAVAVADHHADAPAQPAAAKTDAATAPSAASPAMAHPAADTAVLHSAPADMLPGDVAGLAQTPTALTTPQSASGATVLFIDAQVADPATLIKVAPAGAEVVMLDAASDGLAQMARYLQGRSDVAAIHVLSHGSEADIHLGNMDLNATNIADHAADLTTIGQSLRPGGDILIYGCDVAKSTDGDAFVHAIASATGAHVAASTDATGSASLGGNWVLEDQTAPVNAAIISAPDWGGELAPLVISAPSQPIVTGSGGAGTTIVWQNAGTIGSTVIDLHATITSNTTGVAPTFGTASPNGVAPADDPYILLNNPGSVTLHWEIFLAGSNTVHAVGTPTIQTTDIDGIGGAPFTRETVSPSLYHLTSYTLDNPTNLQASVVGGQLKISGTQDQNAEPTSLASYTWTNVSSWDLTYTLTPNALTPLARTLMDGNGSLTFVDPQTTSMLGIDLDANDSTATGTAYQATFSGTAVAVVDTDVAISEHSALGTAVDSASVVLANAQAGDQLLVAGSAAASGTVNGLSYTVSNSGGQITVDLTGNASLATYQSALKSISFDNALSLPSGVDRQILVSVTNDTFQTTSNEAVSTIHVALNDAPVNTLATSYSTNEDTSLNLTGISVADTDAGAAPISVEFTVGSGNLTMATNVAGGVTAAEVTGNGTGDITISAPLAVINKTLAAAGGLNFLDLPDHNGAVTLTMTTDDLGNTGLGGPMTDVDTRTITVAPVNDAPVEVVPGAQTVNANAQLSVSGISVSDVDANGGLETITLSVGHGTVTLPTHTGLTFTTGDGTADASMVFKGTISDIDAALANLIYTPTANYTGADTLSFTTNDNGNTGAGGALGSGTKTVAITVADVPPVAGDDTFATAAGHAVAITELANDSSPVGLPLTVTKINSTANTAGGAAVAIDHGTVSLSAAGVLTYTPTAGYSGAEAFTYTISDGHGGTDVANVTGTVYAPPVAVNDTFSTAAGHPATIAVTANDSDVNGFPLTITKIGTTAIAPGGASVAVTGGAVALDASGDLVFTPAAGYSGTPTFTYTIDDGHGGTATATVTGTVWAPPVAANNVFATTTDLPISLDVLGNDTDPNGFALTITKVAGQDIVAAGPGVAVTGGTVTIDASGTMTFSPDAGYNGTPSFTYTIDDGHGGTATATVSGTVSPLNHPPVNIVPGDQSFSGSTLALSTANGNAVQVTDDASASAIIQTTVSVDKGSLTLHQTTGLTFLAGDGTADASITIKGTKAAINAALDGMTYTAPAGSTATAQLTITTNDLGQPSGEDIPNGSFDTTLVTVGAGQQTITNQSNVPGWTTTATDHMIEIWGSGFLGVPAYEGIHFAELNANQVAADISTTQIPQGQPLDFSFAHRGRSGVDTMNVTVIDAGADGVFGTADDTTLMNQNFSDGNKAWGVYDQSLGAATGNPIRLIFNSVSSAGGSNSVGNFLDAVHLGTTHLTDTDSVTLTKLPPPVAVNDGFGTAEGAPATIAALANDSDPNGFPLTITAINGTAITPGGASVTVTGGKVALDSANELIFTPNAGYVGTPSFTYTVSDGEGGTATATVTGSVWAPPVATNDSFGTAEGASVTIHPLANDTDPNGFALTVTDINGAPVAAGDPPVSVAGGTVALDASNNLVFTPNAGYAGTPSFTYTVSDGHGGSATATVNGAVWAPPVASDDTFATAAGTPVTIAPLANDTDVNRFPLSVVSVDGNAISAGGASVAVAGGSVALDATGHLIYTPTAGFAGTPSFDYAISDGHGGTATATVNGTVWAPPVASDDTFHTSSGVPVTVAALGNDTDPNGFALSIASVNGHAVMAGGSAVTIDHGTVALTANGALVYTPAAGFNGTESFTYSISDGHGGTATATVSGTIYPPPVAINDGFATALGAVDTIPVLVNDSDPNGFPFDITAVNGTPISAGGPGVAVTGGIVTADGNGNLVFTPNSGYSGHPSFTYTITDDHGGEATATVNGIVYAAPALANDSFATGENVPVSIAVLGNDTDPNGFALSVTSVNGQPLTPGSAPLALDHGTLALTGSGALLFTPTAGYAGPESFTYSVTDGHGGSATATVNGTVYAPPVAKDDAFAVNSGSTATINALANDTDPNAFPLAITAVNGTALTPGGASIPVTGGTIGLDVLGNLDFFPAPGFAGRTSFGYAISDGHGGTATATINGIVFGPPVASNDSFTTVAGQPVTLDVLANDTDPNGLVPVITKINGHTVTAGGAALPTTFGTVALTSAGELLYTPNAISSGTDSFTYTISDNHGTSTATVTGKVEAPPQLDLDGTAAGTGYVATFTEATAPVAIAAPTLSIKDADSTIMSSAVVSLTNAQIADVLTVGALPGGIVAGSFDPISHSITLTGSASLSAYQAAISAITFSNTSADPATTDRIIDVTVTDDTGIASNTAVAKLHVVAVDNAPIEAVPAGLVGTPNAPVAISGLSVSDVDANGGLETVTLSVGHGTLSLASANGLMFSSGSADGASSLSFTGTLADINAALATLSYQAAPGFAGTDHLAFATNDNGNTGIGGPLSTSASISIDVPNHAPVVVDPANPGTPGHPVPAGDPLNVVPPQSGIDGTPISPISVLPYFKDADTGDSLTLSVDPAKLPPGLTFDPATGTIAGTPDNASPRGTYVVPVTATDSHGASVTTEVSFTFADPAPIATPDSATLTQDGPAATGNLLANDAATGGETGPLLVNGLTDSSGAAIPLGVATKLPEGGTLTVSANGQYSFDPGSDFVGMPAGAVKAITVSYGLSDGNGGSAGSTLTLAVTGLNDAPVVIDPANPGTPGHPVPAGDPLNVVPPQSGIDGTPISPISVLPYFKDADTGDSLTLSVDPAKLPPGLTFDPATGTFAGTPSVDASHGGSNPAQPGVYIVPVTATDSHGATTTTSVLLMIRHPLPIAADDQIATNENVAVTGTLAANDHAQPSLPLTYTVVNGPTHGTLDLKPDGTYSYSPAALYFGPDIFTYQVSDGHGGTATATAHLVVTEVNQAPTVTVPDTLATSEQTSLAIRGLGIGDIDAGAGVMTVTLDAQHGVLHAGPPASVVLTGDNSAHLTLTGTLGDINAALGKISYQSLPGYLGSDHVTVSVNDNGNTGIGGAKTATGNVTIIVNELPHINVSTLSAPDGIVAVHDLPSQPPGSNGGVQQLEPLKIPENIYVEHAATHNDNAINAQYVNEQVRFAAGDVPQAIENQYGQGARGTPFRNLLEDLRHEPEAPHFDTMVLGAAGTEENVVQLGAAVTTSPNTVRLANAERDEENDPEALAPSRGFSALGAWSWLKAVAMRW